ncbi:MAG TPA: 16S rRNA (uracil(1498)-N(3))-methyltransferase [Thermoanaerobaculia bacterium]|nr:16S rRNA (uracil(1498)-N(3))-methyltransferase [Thermoanaerobaculia bacterium]
MNLLLLFSEDLVAPNEAIVRGDRRDHVARVLRAGPGDRLRVGLLDGMLGQATVTALDDSCLRLALELREAPPEPLPVHLVLALPRPKFLGRILQGSAAMGVKRIVLLGTSRVERSYWQSSILDAEAVGRQLLLGLEQGRDTVLPVVESWPAFRRFVAERLEDLLAQRLGLVAHGDAPTPFPRGPVGPATLFVGPEGGFLDDEVATLRDAGALPVSLGGRPLRVEQAVSVLLGRLMPDFSP